MRVGGRLALDNQNRITTNPEVCFGKPIIRGLRYTVSFLEGLLNSGWTPEEILKDYPDLEPLDIKAVLERKGKKS